MNLHSELQALVNRYTIQKGELIEKSKVDANPHNGGLTYRDGIIDDTKDVIADLNSLLAKYAKINY